MARSYGRVAASVWIDPDWVALRAREQWLYVLLLSQPKLSMVGCLDYKPARWAALAEGMDKPTVISALDVLEERRFVVVDRATEEVLLRSFTRHDGISPNNPRMVKGLWGAWQSIASPTLRKVAVDNMPEHLFGGSEPSQAAALRAVHPLLHPYFHPNVQVDEQVQGQVQVPPATCNRSQQPIARPDTRLPDELIEQGLSAVSDIRAKLTHREAS